MVNVTPACGWVDGVDAACEPRRKQPERSEQDHDQWPGERDRNVQLRQERSGHCVAHAEPAGTWRLLLHTRTSLEIAQISYTNVTITDTTNGVTASIAGTFDTGCLLPNVRGAC
jgi:hypothetical protein